jgi:hypothetical protein
MYFVFLASIVLHEYTISRNRRVGFSAPRKKLLVFMVDAIVSGLEGLPAHHSLESRRKAIKVLGFQNRIDSLVLQRASSDRCDDGSQRDMDQCVTTAVIRSNKDNRELS